MTKTFDFTLTFSLSRYGSNPENYLDALFEAGCDDVIVGTGMPGSIALNFSRGAKSAEDAIQHAYFTESCHPFHVKAATRNAAKLPPPGA